MTAIPITSDDPNRRRRLDIMKRRATGLLVVAAVVFIAARLFERQYPWVGFVRAAAEAAMVGGLADWFAVTALFRKPMGLPIPHTAIIPMRKDHIGRTLGGFVQNNFLAREGLTSKLRSLEIGARAARWVSEPANSRRIAKHVAAGLARGAELLQDDEVQALIDRGLINQIRRMRVAPILGNGLALVTADNRHQELLDEIIHLVANAMVKHEDMIRERIRAESPWWVPGLVDDKIHDKIITSIEHTLQEISADPHHPMRARFDEAVHRFIESLRTSPDVIARAESIKEELLDHPAVREFSVAMWADLKRVLMRYADKAEAASPGVVEQGLHALGEAVLADPALLETIDHWIIDAILSAVEQYRQEVGQYIAHTVEQWDPNATSERIELAVGRDLQFIRINGTLVGGLVGLLLHALEVLF